MSAFNYSAVQRVYLIGIGGIGMSALARYFHYKGAVVSGYDRTETELTAELQKEGISIHFTDDIAFADLSAELIIYTPAIPKNHSELNYFIGNNYTVKKRAQVLGELSQDKFTIAVAGSHGKTTVSSMIAWILKHSGYDCTAFLGGICVNFNSNFTAGKNDVMVIEADEFDRSFLQLHPSIAVITAIDSDHLEIYGTQAELEKTFLSFANQLKADGTLVVKNSLSIANDLQQHVWLYSLQDSNAKLYTSAFQITVAGSHVRLNNGMEFTLTYPGLHNIENAVAACSVCLILGIEEKKIAEALNVFKGIHRRFETIYHNQDVIFIDDYAHHPEEIAMFLKSVRTIYPGKKITAIFQPHLFSRTKDLADGFAKSLDIADEVILLPIYPARELPVPGVTSALIFEKMLLQKKHLSDKEAMLRFVEENSLEVLCTIGAGDIDKLVIPIAAILKHKKNKHA